MMALSNSKTDSVNNIQQIFPTIVGSLDSGVVVVGRNGCIDLINVSALTILGISGGDPEDFTDKKFECLCEHLEVVIDKYEQIILKRKHKKFVEHVHIPPEKYVKVSAYKKLNWTLFLFEDVTSTNGLIHEATHDYLTQLFNRRYFEARLGDSLASSSSSTQIDCIAFIDLNGFKVINDLAGYMCGDEVLKKVATSILSYIEVDDCAARIGGDEFAILFKNNDLNGVKSILNKIQKKVNEVEVIHGGKVMRIDFSAGVTEVSSDFYETTDHAFAASILACGLSKNSTSTQIRTLSGKEVDNSIVVRDSSVINLLANAITDNRLSLFGQNIVPRTGHSDVKNIEVLLRMKDESGDYISPSLFIPIAERSRTMSDLDMWVISNSFRLVKENHRLFINISGQSLCDAEVFRHILRESKRNEVREGSIVFEITETGTITELGVARKHMLSLKEAGFEFALDDFGTGFSSLLYLKHLPVSIIKIAGQFVKEMHFDDLSFNMVNMIFGMANDLGLETVAEHVHCKEVYRLLQKSQTDFLQGFFIHRPESLASMLHP